MVAGNSSLLQDHANCVDWMPQRYVRSFGLSYLCSFCLLLLSGFVLHLQSVFEGDQGSCLCFRRHLWKDAAYMKLIPDERRYRIVFVVFQLLVGSFCRSEKIICLSNG